MKRDNTSCSLKGIFVVIGAVVSIAALIVVVYTIFKKYFRVTFECDGCDGCDEACFADDETYYEPICCCDDEDDDCECGCCEADDEDDAE